MTKREYPIHPGPKETLERDQWLDEGLAKFSSYVDRLPDAHIPEIVKSMATIVQYRLTAPEPDWKHFLDSMPTQQTAFTAFVLACAQSPSRYQALSPKTQLFVDSILTRTTFYENP